MFLTTRPMLVLYQVDLDCNTKITQAKDEQRKFWNNRSALPYFTLHRRDPCLHPPSKV